MEKEKRVITVDLYLLARSLEVYSKNKYVRDIIRSLIKNKVVFMKYKRKHLVEMKANYIHNGDPYRINVDLTIHGGTEVVCDELSNKTFLLDFELVPNENMSGLNLKFNSIRLSGDDIRPVAFK